MVDTTWTITRQLARDDAMALQKPDNPHGFFGWYRNLSRSKKVILVVMSIWAAQAVPKWTAAITADGELSARIMKVFVAPRGIN